MSGETIFALSSGSGMAGVAVIRISGPQAHEAVKALCGDVPGHRQAVLRTLKSPKDGKLLDRGLVIVFHQPGSFTGEDLAELHVHGGLAVVRAVLSCLAEMSGLRPAEAGEFTRRAFSNGKIDLLMAEGIGDLIEAETEKQHQQALYQMDGLSGDRIAQWREQIVEAIAMVEASIDFIDEEGVADQALMAVVPAIEALRDRLMFHVNQARSGEIIREGARVVIAGVPNAGKSSLLNRLAGREAAIVTEIPGTTRDVIEIKFDLEGLAVILCDTAGLHSQTDDPVEMIGIERTHQVMARADLVVWLEAPGTQELQALQGLDSPALRVRSKADLLPSAPDRGDELAISSHTGEGIDELLRAIHGQLIERYDLSEPLVVVRERHRHAVMQAIEHLNHALADDSEVLEGIAESLRLAARSLATLTGEVGVEDILDRIFSRFCIGK